MDADDLQEVLVTRTESIDPAARATARHHSDDKPGPSLSRPRVLDPGSYSRFRNQGEFEEASKAAMAHCVDGDKQHHLHAIHGGPVVSGEGSDQCNNLTLASGRIQNPMAPSTMEDGMPMMYPRDADVLPTAALMTCCCPLCGCVSIIYAKKARRLRLAGKFHASAQATEASTWWAWSAALSGCFILLGVAVSAMIFLLMMYV